MTRPLASLLPAGAEVMAGDAAMPVAGLTADSRKVVPGGLFLAVPGTKADGLAFVPQALAAGAAVIVAERAPEKLPAGVALVLVPSARMALTHMAARFYPRQPATIVAVTGTSGKTSVASFTRQIFAQAGEKAAYLGTLGVETPEGLTYGSLTTPDPVDLHALLDRLAGEGVTHMALEASSHGLDQGRLDGVRLTAGAFTHLGRDHLDYHPTLEDYLAAKVRLFDTLLAPGTTAVINTDGAESAKVAAAAAARGLDLFTVGRTGGDLTLLSVTPEGFGQRLVIDADSTETVVNLPLMGAFQASNALVAAGLAIAGGVPTRKALKALESLKGVPGRLERVGEKPFADGPAATVFVDYAHKPDALEDVLKSLRPFTRGKLVVAFGCGGDRDPGKRPIMGEIAVRLADRVIITDDNPRSEEPAAIRAAILATAPGAIETGDRKRAIVEGVAGLGPGDVFVIAGKGHETGQTIRGETFPFSDQEEAVKALAKVNT